MELVGIGFDLGGHIQQLLLTQAGGIVPGRAWLAPQQVGRHAVRDAELGVPAAGVAVPAELHPLQIGGADKNLLNVVGGEAMLPFELIQAVQRRLDPHIGGPVLEQELVE